MTEVITDSLSKVDQSPSSWTSSSGTASDLMSAAILFEGSLAEWAALVNRQSLNGQDHYEEGSRAAQLRDEWGAALDQLFVSSPNSAEEALAKLRAAQKFVDFTCEVDAKACALLSQAQREFLQITQARGGPEILSKKTKPQRSSRLLDFLYGRSGRRVGGGECRSSKATQ